MSVGILLDIFERLLLSLLDRIKRGIRDAPNNRRYKQKEDWIPEGAARWLICSALGGGASNHYHISRQIEKKCRHRQWLPVTD